MTHALVFFEDDQAAHLEPLTLTRPVHDLRIGLTTIRETWERALGFAAGTAPLRPHLRGVFPAATRRQRTSPAVWINARYRPTPRLLATIRRRDLLPEAVLLETLDTLGEKVSRVKLYDWIRAKKLQPRGYVHHGRIVPHRIQRGDPRVFSLSHARALRSQEAV